MRNRHFFVVLIAATLVCSFGIAAGPDALVSGPQAGSKLPDVFQPLPLPGAKHLEWKELIAEDGRFKSAAQLKALFHERGIKPEQTAVTC
jgi:hypothetical protein